MNLFPDTLPQYNPVTILQKLIQFNTTNPPGNERECILYIRDLLAEEGIESQLFAMSPERPNLIARLPGEGKSAPLLLYGHVDVVTTENQTWSQPPFAGNLVDGFVWGRGALDMKGGVAMLLAAFIALKRQGIQPPGDVILAVVTDEEAGGDFGARFLVEKHPELFTGVRSALGEFGGFNLPISGKRFYPIQIAEKQICVLRATVHGEGGHGSLPVRFGAMYKMGKLLSILSSQRLPVHITPPARQMIEAIASNLGGVSGKVLGQLLNPLFTDRILDLLGERGRIFGPLLRHSVSPTILHASSKINVIPGEVSVDLDGRMLPGYKPDDFVHEVQQICPSGVILEMLDFSPGPENHDLDLFGPLSDILRQLDPTGIPIPLLLSGVTDARFFARLGIQTYGFLPLQLPDNFNFSSVIHAADERVPAAALDFGARGVFEVLRRF